MSAGTRQTRHDRRTAFTLITTRGVPPVARRRRASMHPGRAFGLVAVLVLIAVACNGPWGAPHAGPDQSGYNPAERIIGVDDVATLTQTGFVPGGGSFLSLAVDNKKVFVVGENWLAGYDPGLGTRLWSGAFPTEMASAPVAADGRVFAISRALDGSGNVVTGALQAFDATRTTPCGEAMNPTPCPPLWQAPTGTDFASPTVVDGVVYAVGDLGGAKQLQAYDASGRTGCSGTPKVCTPLWTAGPLSSVATPAVVDGRVYVATLFNGVSVFDAAGVTGCSGTPKVCAPLFTTTGDNNSNFVSVVGERIVRFNGGGNAVLSVFDATGTQNCSGVPAVCSPLWTASAASAGLFATPAIAYGNIYLPTPQGMQVFDLAGTTGCGGAPKTCAPLRTIDLSNPAAPTATFGTNFSGTSIANGVGYIGNDAGDVIAFDAQSVSGCAGVPLRCPQLWRTNLGGGRVMTTPVVADGALYLGTFDHVLRKLTPSP